MNLHPHEPIQNLLFNIKFIKIIMITPPTKLHPHDEENFGYP